MNQRLPQILSCGVALSVTYSDGVPGAVVLNHKRMIHREVCGLLLEIRHGIATRSHRFAEQAIRFIDGCIWVVHKPRLYDPPLLDVTVACCGSQRVNVILFNAFLEFFEFRFATGASGFAYRTIVFGAKMLAKPSGLLC